MRTCSSFSCNSKKYKFHVLQHTPAEDLRAAGHDDAAARLHVDHVGAGVDHAQRAVHLKGVGKGAALVALRQHQLEDVAALQEERHETIRCEQGEYVWVQRACITDSTLDAAAALSPHSLACRRGKSTHNKQ